VVSEIAEDLLAPIPTSGDVEDAAGKLKTG
jgi:hypothetical protein